LLFLEKYFEKGRQDPFTELEKYDTIIVIMGLRYFVEKSHKKELRREGMDFLFPIALATDMPTWLVCILGVSVVFVGLICIIGILYLMNFLISKTEGKKTEKTTVATPAAPAPAPVAAPIENRREIVAAVCAAVAEEEGTDISAIRVISFKKL